VPPMAISEITAAFDAAVSSRRLLDHPYYRAWEAGALTVADLAAYAAQYRHLEACLVEVLSDAARAAGDPGARRLVEANLADELGPTPHLDLFDGFAAAVGAERDAPSDATARLVTLYRDAAAAGPVAALAVVGAYETQAAEIAAVKSASLQERYGLDGDAVAFWDLHARLETLHGSWTSEALTALGAETAVVEGLARRSAEAWWAFLDDRDAARAA